MSPAELLGSAGGLAWVCLITLVAGLAHGVSGFGFPLISTPMVALFTDVRTAVLVTLFPNIVVNVASATSGSDWRDNLRRFRAMPLWVLLGAVVGTQVVIWAPADALRLFLAAIIVVYLQQDRIRGIDWSAVARHPDGAGMAFGLLGGFLSGTVNVMLPPMLIYFSTLAVPAVVMTQVLNACFLVGKVTQAVVFALHGRVDGHGLLLTVPVCVVGYAGYVAGRRLQPRVSPALYRKMIRAVLWGMAALLVAQAAGLVGRR
ncbi:MAG TPA: sulfite exporter TauE/SafE family protein [Usitatibacter sp.]|jgi:hypothetical protein|nr:sulfite exporter TauE/SafE family protein [Usitatibacter sp.]